MRQLTAVNDMEDIHMYKILEAGKLAGNIYQMVVEAPRVAKHCLPGQFVIVKAG